MGKPFHEKKIMLSMRYRGRVKRPRRSEPPRGSRLAGRGWLVKRGAIPGLVKQLVVCCWDRREAGSRSPDWSPGVESR